MFMLITNCYTAVTYRYDFDVEKRHPLHDLMSVVIIHCEPIHNGYVRSSAGSGDSLMLHEGDGACANTSHSSSHDFGWQSSHSVDLAGWQAKMASIEIWTP